LGQLIYVRNEREQIQMKTEENRVCPFCDETIRAAARVCPHCRQPLSFQTIRHPVTGMLVLALPMMAIFIAAGVLIASKFDSMVNPRPYFDEQPQSLKLTQSHMNWVHLTNGEWIYLVGTITNQSEVPWKNIELNYRFFDASGVLIDAGSTDAGCYVLPKDEAAFRIQIRTRQPTNEYRSFKLSISSARSARSMF
jgi:hypothetical protein